MIDSLEGAQRHITRGWIAGAVMAGMTLLIAITGSTQLPAYSRFGFADAALASFLTFGVYRRSRAAAVAILSLFVVTTTFKLTLVGFRPLFLLLAGGFVYFYAQAVRGTLAYHRLADQTTPGPERAA